MTKLILVGGFLGAGKTTLLLQAAHQLVKRGLRPGLITNDQGQELVDTALADHQKLSVVEVAGGCFCCRFPDLLEGMRYLQRTVAPDVIVAEPVGSCTDLLATVVRPLMAYHPGIFEIAPFTVLVDTGRTTSHFSAEVQTLYQQQLTEAEIIALTKADLLSAIESDEARRTIELRYGPTPVLTLSGQSGAGVNAWLERVLQQTSQAAKTLEIDYQAYAQAEAQLGWLNASGVLQADNPFLTRNWLAHWLHMFDEALTQQRAAIAHVKLWATTADAIYKASLTQSGGEVSWDLTSTGVMANRLEFTLNARVQAAPRTLEQTVRQLFAEMTPEPEFHYDFSHFECFSPSPPKPTHRLNKQSVSV